MCLWMPARCGRGFTGILLLWGSAGGVCFEGDALVEGDVDVDVQGKGQADAESGCIISGLDGSRFVGM
jgi:hypothetical protein